MSSTVQACYSRDGVILFSPPLIQGIWHAYINCVGEGIISMTLTLFVGFVDKTQTIMCSILGRKLWQGGCVMWSVGGCVMWSVGGHVMWSVGGHVMWSVGGHVMWSVGVGHVISRWVCPWVMWSISEYNSCYVINRHVHLRHMYSGWVCPWVTCIVGGCVPESHVQ